MTVAHQEHRMTIAFFPKAEALTLGFVVTILVAKRGVSHRVEQVHLQNRLKGELTDNVA
ncbi:MULTISPECIES: hypothetical protein [unclassified Microcoleus]|uniref:hypothetical protein n=1 Tax=unclassified Microcoleus TaxID=2642155 RepID=UPI002FD33615